MAAIRLEDLRKTYPGGHEAVRGVDLTIADGELLVLVGPSGCGKSTLLRLIAGLESPTTGRIAIGDRDVTPLAPPERDLAMVFQSYALYPHMSVRENLAFPLRMRHVTVTAVAARVREVAKLLGLEALLEQRPRQLSGGQRQRVALGRAMVREPMAFLLDEPLSNLDPALRVRTRAELARIHRRLRATMLYVTHDQEEAMTLGDRIAVMHEGRLQQVSAPLDAYRQPANVFVAAFIGSPAMNLLEVSITADHGAPMLRGPALRLAGPAVPELPPGTPLTLGVRPHDITLADTSESADLTGRVEVIEPLGPVVHVHAVVPDESDGLALRVVLPAEHAVRVGDRLPLRLRRDRLHLFARDTGSRVGPAAHPA